MEKEDSDPRHSACSLDECVPTVQVYHLKALNEVERQRWVTAMELAKAQAIKSLDSGTQLNTYMHVHVCRSASVLVIAASSKLHVYSGTVWTILGHKCVLIGAVSCFMGWKRGVCEREKCPHFRGHIDAHVCVNYTSNFLYIVYCSDDDSGGEEDGNVGRERRDKSLSVLQAKMKEFSSSHDTVVKTRFVREKGER